MKSGEIGVFKTYELFNAMKLHWNTNYDFVKYNGKVKNLTRMTLDRAPEKHFYEHLNKRHKTADSLIIFLIPCFLDDPKRGLDKYFTESASKLSDDWFWKIKKLKSNFDKDVRNILAFIKENKLSFEYFFKSDLIYNALSTDQINIESFIILDRVINFVDKFSSNDIIYNNVLRSKTKNYSSFIAVNLENYKQLFEHGIKEVKSNPYVKTTLSL